MFEGPLAAIAELLPMLVKSIVFEFSGFSNSEMRF